MKTNLVLIIFLISTLTYAQTLTGKVVGIMDGDTFKILVDIQPKKYD